MNQMSNSQLRDPAIKLFGRNIPRPDSNIPTSHRRSTDETKDENGADKSCEHDKPSGSSEEAERAAKRVVPCPRCNSSETKFCYFNNYNVNQPRHFCRSCHRYWTAGGTIRNVPVGAGRRRNPKPSPVESPSPSPSPSSSSSESSNPVPHPAWSFVMVGPENGYPVMPLLPGWGYVPVPRDPGANKTCVWVPKTLRIDDPNEAAKSSIWSTLGIQPDGKNGGFTRSGVFKPFKRKLEGVDDCESKEGERVLKSNPAALSRSNSFKEIT